MKIASLLASNTEIACALGLENELVGISHECDYPPHITSKPVLTRSSIDHFKKSHEIDQDVRNLLQQALSIYQVDEEKLKKLNPDVILTQDQCEVCAVSLKDVKNALLALDCHATIVSLKPSTLGDIFENILEIGHVTQRISEAQILVTQLKQRVHDIRKKSKLIKDKPKICNIEWIDPIMIAGNWVPEMVEIAGGQNIISRKGEHTGYNKIEDILNEQPDKIVIAPCGFKMEQTLKDLPLLTQKPLWQKLKAVQNGEVYVVDGNSYFNRPSHRIVDTLEILASIIHPKIFPNKNKYFLKLS